MPKRRGPYTKRKVVGQSRNNALVLFGLRQGKMMEKPEQRRLIASVLAHSDDERMRRLSKCLVDQAQHMRTVSCAVHAEACGVNGYMIADELRKAWRTQGLVEQAELLPEVMRQTAEDALSRWEECTSCDGTGRIADPAVTDHRQLKHCKNCHGKGKVYVMGDLDNRKLLFETHGLTSKGGAGVQVLNINNPANPGETLHALAESLGPILEGDVK